MHRIYQIAPLPELSHCKRVDEKRQFCKLEVSASCHSKFLSKWFMCLWILDKVYIVLKRKLYTVFRTNSCIHSHKNATNFDKNNLILRETILSNHIFHWLVAIFLWQYKTEWSRSKDNIPFQGRTTRWPWIVMTSKKRKTSIMLTKKDKNFISNFYTDGSEVG